MQAKESKPHNKRSLQAIKAAKLVSENIRKGKRVNMGKILKEVGYSDSVSKSPYQVTTTKSFQEALEPHVEKLAQLRDILLDEMVSPRRVRKLKKDKLINLSTALKNTVHDHQLLTGGKTENTGFQEMAKSYKELIEKLKFDK